MTKAALVINVWTKGQGQKLPKDLPEALEQHVEHVSDLCAGGYRAGDIIDEKFSGWWRIVEGENL